MGNILDDMLHHKGQPENSYPDSEKGKRFANHIIDMVAYYILAIIVGILSVAFTDTAAYNENNFLVDLVLPILVLLSYYTGMEAMFDGKTIGKYLTGTRAIRLDGEPMDFKTAFVRSILRLVPFEAFSFLGPGRGWHDQWSDTRVVDERHLWKTHSRGGY